MTDNLTNGLASAANSDLTNLGASFIRRERNAIGAFEVRTSKKRSEHRANDRSLSSVANRSQKSLLNMLRLATVDQFLHLYLLINS